MDVYYVVFDWKIIFLLRYIHLYKTKRQSDVILHGKESPLNLKLLFENKKKKKTEFCVMIYWRFVFIRCAWCLLRLNKIWE